MFGHYDATAANATTDITSTATITCSAVVEDLSATAIPEVEIRYYYLRDIVFRPVVRAFKRFLLSARIQRHRAREDGL